MNRAADHRFVTASEKVFARLLALYPRNHRKVFGPAMAQLFRDQCRDAWRERQRRGLALLWLRIIPDLVKTSFLEHLATLKPRQSMLEKLNSLLRPRSAPVVAFVTLFGVVFCLVFGAAAVVTFLLPETYLSTTRLLLREAPAPATSGPQAISGSYDPYLLQTEFEVLQSEAVLGKAIDALNLNEAWGRKYAGGAPLKTRETLTLLRRRIELRPVRNTMLFEIRAFSENPDEAARIANAIGDAYRVYRLEEEQRQLELGGAKSPPALRVAIIERAEPGLRPVRPNKPLNLGLGAVAGTLLGLAAGAGAAGIAHFVGRSSRAKAAA